MGTDPGLRERKKQKTRGTIQEHALRLIAAQGYDATTVDQIAAAAEISPSTFFRYFKSKEDVVIEDDYDPIMMAEFLAAPAELPPVAAFRYALREAMSKLTEDELRRVWERTQLQLSVPALRARSLENFLSTRDMIGEAIAQRTGRRATDLEVRSYAGALMGVLLAALLDWYEAGGKPQMVDVVDSALAHLEAGLPLS